MYALKQERLPVHMSFNSVAWSNLVNNVSILQGIRSLLGRKLYCFFFFSKIDVVLLIMRRVSINFLGQIFTTQVKHHLYVD